MNADGLFVCLLCALGSGVNHCPRIMVLVKTTPQYRGGSKNTFFECAVGEPKMLIMCDLGRFVLVYGRYQPFPPA